MWGAENVELGLGPYEIIGDLEGWFDVMLHILESARLALIEGWGTSFDMVAKEAKISAGAQ